MRKENVIIPRILLVEDNLMDVELTKECFNDAKIYAKLDHTENGVEALEYMKNIKPDIILLDLNMPKMDGREFLEIIKKEAQYKHIPVVILTTSDSNEDIIKSYNLQASAYLSKPVNYEDFIEMMKSFDDFYLTFVRFPRDGEEID